MALREGAFEDVGAHKAVLNIRCTGGHVALVLNDGSSRPEGAGIILFNVGKTSSSRFFLTPQNKPTRAEFSVCSDVRSTLPVKLRFYADDVVVFVCLFVCLFV